MSNMVPEGWETEPVGNLFHLHRESVQPNDFPDETFEYYNLPAYDDTGTFSYADGQEIESNKTLLSHPTAVVPAQNQPTRKHVTPMFAVRFLTYLVHGAIASTRLVQRLHVEADNRQDGSNVSIRNTTFFGKWENILFLQYLHNKCHLQNQSS